MNDRLVIRLGLTCNNNCKFCIFGKEKNMPKDNNRPKEHVMKILDSNPGYKSIVFTGGEPCLRPDIIDLVKYTKSSGFKQIQIQSNGRMFSYKNLCSDFINAGANEFALAIHGHTRKIHDDLTCANGSFAQTTKGIENLKKLGQYVITNTVITNANYRYLPQMAKMLVKLGIEHFQFSFIHLIGNAWKNRAWISPKKTEVIPFVKRAIDIGHSAGKRVTTEAIPYCLLRDYEDNIVEAVIPKSKVFELGSTISDLKAHRIYKKKIKRMRCIKCRHYSKCEGPWKEYPELFGWEEFNPALK